MRRRDFDLSGTPHFLNRVVGIIQNIEKHLLQLVRIADGERQIVVVAFGQLHAVVREIVGPKLQRLLQDGIHPHRFALRRHLPRKAQKILNDHPRALRFLQDHAQFFLGLVGNRRILEQQIGETHNRGQRIVHLVRDAGNELAQRRHFFRVHQFGLQVGGIGDVRHHHDNAVDVALFVPHGAQADRKMPGRAVAAKNRNLQIVDRCCLREFAPSASASVGRRAGGTISTSG